MAKEKPEETRTSIDNINDTLTSVEQKVQKNQKLIMWLSLGAAAIVALIFIYIYGVRRPAINAGDDAIGQADAQLMQGNDSIALAQYMQVADEHGYDAGNRARLNAAILAQVAEGKAVTADIGGTATTTEFTDAVAARL